MATIWQSAWASGKFSWLPTVRLCCRETFAEHGSKVDPPAMQEYDVQVLVLRLQTKGNVEERVLETSAQKRSLADRSITGMCYSVQQVLQSCTLVSLTTLVDV